MMNEETLGAADINDILRLLPHRYPFLLIDRVTDIRGEDHGIGIKNVTMNEPHFAGHFPDNPVMPGVLMVEGMAQTASILVLRLLPPPVKRRTMFFLTIDKAKFRKPARPGDILEYHVDKLSRRRGMWWYRGEAKVGGALIAEAEIGAYLSEE
jgi:3-hydroxyacyl-[acyl-carrier-protein] dehydratase